MRYFLALLLFSISLSAQVKPLPWAYGAAADTTNNGWRGGTVIHVTSLDDDYTDVQEGTYRWAVTRTYPRIVVFDVSGDISLSGRIVLGNSNSNLYIAGQTSPNGIMIRGYSHWSSDLDDVVIVGVQFYGDPLLRDAPNDPSAPAARQLWQFEGGNNILIDHTEWVFNDNEAVNFWGDNSTPFGNGTLQNSVIGEGVTGQIMGADEASTLAGENSSIRNLYVHISHRMPNFSSDVAGEAINNVIYNSKARLARVSQVAQANFYGNYYKAGSATFWSIFSRRNLVRDDDGADVYLGDTAADFNYMDTYATTEVDFDEVFKAADSGTNVASDPQPSTSNWLRATPVSFTYGERPPIMAADSAFAHVLANVGARHYLNADGTYDTVVTAKLQQYLDDTQNGTNTNGSGSDYGNELGTYDIPTITETTRPAGYDTDDDGMPDTWETATFGDLTRDGTGDFDGDGYTDLEEFLNLAYEGTAATAGYTVTPTAGLTTTEASGTDTFDVVLDVQPTTDVVFDITSNDTSEGTVSSATLTFTSANWDTSQTITVTGQDDALDDGNIAYTVTVSVNDASSDDEFDALADVNVSLTNTDDEAGGQQIRARGGFVKINGSWVRIKQN